MDRFCHKVNKIWLAESQTIPQTFPPPIFLLYRSIYCIQVTMYVCIWYIFVTVSAKTSHVRTKIKFIFLPQLIAILNS